MIPSPSTDPEYRQALEFLYRLRPLGAKLGLDQTLNLTRLAGNPQADLRFIHVAGTNGKGSTCAMLESIYRQAGLRVGLFTSPHLSQFGERIQVDRCLIRPEDVVRLLARLKPLLAQFPSDAHPTFFEVVTVMGLLYFQEQQCDLVVWETGLGGRHDSTNIVTPVASVITNIGLDHEQWLGGTLPQIAGEKAGIIKRGVPVLTAVDQPQAFQVIQRAAAELNAPLTQLTLSHLCQPPFDSLRLPLAGYCHRVNAGLAVATVRLLAESFPVGEAAIRAGLESLQWPGRAELVQTRPGQQCFLDGAHNPAAAQALVETLRSQFPDQRPVLVLGLFRDKSIETFCEELAPLADTIFTVPIASQRTAAPAAVATHCSGHNPTARVVTCDSLEAALEQARDFPLIVITGSIYLVGQTRELLGLTPGEHGLERSLNDWTGTRSG